MTILRKFIHKESLLNFYRKYDNTKKSYNRKLTIGNFKKNYKIFLYQETLILENMTILRKYQIAKIY